VTRLRRLLLPGAIGQHLHGGIAGLPATRAMGGLPARVIPLSAALLDGHAHPAPGLAIRPDVAIPGHVPVAVDAHPGSLPCHAQHRRGGQGQHPGGSAKLCSSGQLSPDNRSRGRGPTWSLFRKLTRLPWSTGRGCGSQSKCADALLDTGRHPVSPLRSSVNSASFAGPNPPLTSADRPGNRPDLVNYRCTSSVVLAQAAPEPSAPSWTSRH